MPPTLLFDVPDMDYEKPVFSHEEIYSDFLPHRFEFALLNKVLYHKKEPAQIATLAELRADDYWVRGHIPGRPILPGVLMLEMAAQTACILASLTLGIRSTRDAFIGFGGVDTCKFRDSITPPNNVLFLGVGIDQKPRRVVTLTQALVNGKVIFEATITGILMRARAKS